MMKRIGLTAGALFRLDNGMAYTAPVTIEINREGEQYYSAKKIAAGFCRRIAEVGGHYDDSYSENRNVFE